MADRTTILAPVLTWVSRSHIEALDQVYGPGRPRRGVSRWSPCGALVFAPLAGRHRVRDGACALASQAHALAPLGLRPPKRSTLAEANARRPAALSQALFETRYARCRGVAPKHRFRCKNPLWSRDRTTISRGWRVFPWAGFRTTTGAITVPTRLDQAGHIPAVMVLTEGQRRDRAVARGFHLPGDSIVTRDRGDIDDQCLCRLHQEGVYFVTRQQVKAQVEVTTRVAIDRSTGVTADHDVVLTGPKGRADPARLRQVHDRDAATGNREVLWTQALHVAAPTSAAIDQQRWPIALFLKAIQQHRRIKTFWGTSEQAVMTQVWVALIADLLLACRRFQAGLALSCQQMLRLLHINRFERRTLMARCRLQPPDAAGSQR